MRKMLLFAACIVILVMGFVLQSCKDKEPEEVAEVTEPAEEEETAKVEVPNVVSLPFDQAVQKLEEEGLEVKKAGPKPTLDFKAGEVMGQSPEALTSVEPGNTITLTVAGDSVKVPDVKGQTLQQAMQKMAERRLFVKVKGDQLDGKVAGTNPDADTVVLKESHVNVTMPGKPVIITYPAIIKKYPILKKPYVKKSLRARGEEEFDPLALMREESE